MRISEFPISTNRETPADAEIISHQLMLRSGLINKISSGLYTWMPLGLRVLRKVENIVREEMNRAGALEILMPAIQPAELWQESQRWDAYGLELLRIQDRHNRNFVFGPTHEEVITAIARRELKSYKQLPVNYYQIQTKFRDEIRPRFGVMRAREFIMKDAYSFHIDSDSLDETYQNMYKTYTRILTRLQLTFRAVLADTGSIGGVESHEFHILADSGEDAIAFAVENNYAANVELAPTYASDERPSPGQLMSMIDTPGIATIKDLCGFLQVKPKQCLKAIFVQGNKDKTIAIFIRGDHILNTHKAEKHPLIASPLCFSDEKDILEAAACHSGSLGPVNLNIPIIADYAASQLADFVCGANQDGKHYTGVNWERDVINPETADLRNIEVGDPSPVGNGTVAINRGIEVGHIFKLGTKYSKTMKAEVLNRDGKMTTMTMGCYGIGVSRIVAAAIEQNYDDAGIIWPLAIAPFQAIIIPLQHQRNQQVKTVAEQLLDIFAQHGIDALLDDRDVTAGIAFADADLIGIPYRFVVSPRSLKEKKIECKRRNEKENHMLAIEDCINFILSDSV